MQTLHVPAWRLPVNRHPVITVPRRSRTRGFRLKSKDQERDVQSKRKADGEFVSAEERDVQSNWKADREFVFADMDGMSLVQLSTLFYSGMTVLAVVLGGVMGTVAML